MNGEYWDRIKSLDDRLKTPTMLVLEEIHDIKESLKELVELIRGELRERRGL